MMLKNIPNALTLTRLILIAPFLVLLYQQDYIDAFYIFILAGLTDGFDGWLARYFHWQSPFGTLVDPLADKILITSSFLALALIGKLPWWLVILVFIRDATIGLGALTWYWLTKRKQDFIPTYISKINTVLQLALVMLCLFEQAFFVFSPYLNSTLLILTALTTSASFLNYIWTWGNKVCLVARSTK
ncbi:CDP-alcohol phosphatidyltransferase family protein [bacterium]|nr:CDP-alcohol phosphatidyltransferase family protein [bacterium]